MAAGPSRRRVLTASAGTVLLAGSPAAPAVGSPPPQARQARRETRTGDRVHRSTTIYGHSVRGVPLVAHHYAHTDDRHPIVRRVVALGCIHGNEQAGIAVLRELWTTATPPPLGVEYVFLFHPNIDGERRDTRQNADEVDLNRNFPTDWRLRGHPGDLTYSGPRRLSEPESRAALALIDRVRPTIVLSYHQPLNYVGSIGGNQRYAKRFAAAVRQRYLNSSKPDGTGAVYTGTLSEWVNKAHPDVLMLTTELPRPVSPALRRRHQRAIADLARTYTPLPGDAASERTSAEAAPAIGE